MALYEPRVLPSFLSTFSAVRAEFVRWPKAYLYRSLGQRPRSYIQVGLAEGLVFTVAEGKRSAALGLVGESSRLAEGHIHVS